LVLGYVFNCNDVAFQGLRLLRVVIHIRHARLLSEKVQEKLRGLVSQNRRRFVKHGFDLDCTYITSRVSASIGFLNLIDCCKNIVQHYLLINKPRSYNNINLSVDQVIAMSAPVFGRHRAYRNDIHVVSRFFFAFSAR
jgi:hypothetical protein